MSTLSDRDIIYHKEMIYPFYYEKKISHGMSFGLSCAGYDIRNKYSTTIQPKEFVLLSSIEKFKMPDNILGMVMDKSSWARQGISLFNTVIEPGWKGYLTIEVINHSDNRLVIEAGHPIAQIVFHYLHRASFIPYNGKYQDQPNRPIETIMERAN